MRGWGFMALVAATLVWMTGGPALADGELQAPIRIHAAGAPIDTATGHAAPFAHDWDGDGLWDLLVGQMGGGKLRVYRNVGAVGTPRFDAFQVFQVGGQDATVPSG